MFEKLRELGFNEEPEELQKFKYLASQLALRQSEDGTYYYSNWLRGPLLYALVQAKHPRRVLEFGTGRGYGAVCMAQASVDAGFECTVLTIDQIPETRKQQWIIDEGSGPQVKSLSLKEAWSRFCPSETVDRITVLAGDSSSIMARWRHEGLMKVDLVFLDAGHDYWSVKHDFLAALAVANPHASFVFDDYGERQRYGVKRLFDTEIAPRCIDGDDVEIIDTYAEVDRVGAQVDHRMALLEGRNLPLPKQQFFSSPYQRLYLDGYRVAHNLRRLAWQARAIGSPGARVK